MNKKMIYLFYFIPSFFYISAFANESIVYTILSEEKNFQRPINDRINAVVIYDMDGLNKFYQDYPVAIDLPKDVFQKHIIIAGFSNSANAVRPTGFEYKINNTSSMYYLTLEDTGVKYKRSPPREGHRYTAYCVILVDRSINIANIQIREGVPGLFKQYGNK
jgi:hypothetical protein